MDTKNEFLKTPVTPSEYKNGKLHMPMPAKPVIGIGNARIRWRKDGLLENHGDAGGSIGTRFKKVERSLQIWFFELLPDTHKAKPDKKYYVTPEALKIFIDNLEFWKSEWNRVRAFAAQDKKEKSKARARHAIRKRAKIDNTITQAANVAGYEKTELKSKLTRLKSMLHNKDSRMLALELIKDAEPWLLECILAGASIKKINDDELEIDSGPFFKSKIASEWVNRGESYPSIELVFWLSVVRAQSFGCCPKSIYFDDITELDLSISNDEERRLALVCILPSIKSIQFLTLRFDYIGIRFTTDELPAMESLSELWIFGNFEDSYLKLESIERHTSLKRIRIFNFLELDCENDQCDIFSQLKIDISCSSHLKKISKTGLRILLLQESFSDRMAINTIRHKNDLLNLSSLENLPSELAVIIAESGVNYCLPSSCLDAKVIEILTNFTGHLHLIGNCPPDQLRLMMNLKCDLFLELEDELAEESAKLLAEFNSKKLGIYCPKASAKSLYNLIQFKMPLVFGFINRCWNYEFKIDADLANILQSRKAPLILDENWKISSDAMALLAKNVYLDLTSYRRIFEKSEKQGISNVILENLYDSSSSHNAYLLRSTRTNPRGIVKVMNEFRSSIYNNKGVTYLEAAASKLLQSGWKEVKENKIIG